MTDDAYMDALADIALERKYHVGGNCSRHRVCPECPPRNAHKWQRMVWLTSRERTVTANHLAQWFDIHPRQARRYLVELREFGLADIISRSPVPRWLIRRVR